MNWQRLHNTLEATETRNVTPGGVVSIGHRGQVIYTHPFGYTRPDGARVEEESVFDIASLTKPFTALLTAKILGADLSSRLSEYVKVPSAVGGVTVEQLLGHAAGFPAHVKYYERIWANESETAGRQQVFNMACETPLESPPGQTARYSDVGYILLGLVTECITARRLDVSMRETLFAPIGLRSTRFVDLTEQPVYRFPVELIAPTEICPRRGLVVGEVHDENCHAGGGIMGHAGLFYTAPNLSRIARELCAAWHGKSQHLDRALVTQLATTQAAPDTTWRLGFDTPSQRMGASHAGDLWPRDGFGHLGFTGCSVWLAPRTESWVVILTNRVHPTRENSGIRELRRHVMDEAARVLDELDPTFRV